MIETLAVVFVGLGLAEFVAWLAIVFQYSVRAGILFRLAITILKFASMFSAFALAYLVIDSPDIQILGLDALTLLAIFFISQLAIRWMLNIYMIKEIWKARQ